MGYYKAGFDVTGVDIKFQRDYPFKMIQADAMEFDLTGWDYIHASPPCQSYSPSVSSQSSEWSSNKGLDEPQLITPLRERFKEFGTEHYVIENVMGAKWDMVNPTLLCGSMFGLDTPRHRLFETNFVLPAPVHPSCHGMAAKAAERRGVDPNDMAIAGKGRRAGITELWKDLLGIDWHITQRALVECIPPAYTEYIGQQLLSGREPIEVQLVETLKEAEEFLNNIVVEQVDEHKDILDKIRQVLRRDLKS